jgi:hypothetical protein
MARTRSLKLDPQLVRWRSPRRSIGRQQPQEPSRFRSTCDGVIQSWLTTWLCARIGFASTNRSSVRAPEVDVRHYVDPKELAELFDELVLPPTVRRTWEEWFLRHDEARAEC